MTWPAGVREAVVAALAAAAVAEYRARLDSIASNANDGVHSDAPMPDGRGSTGQPSRTRRERRSAGAAGDAPG
jgi:hypothetical protein